MAERAAFSDSVRLQLLEGDVDHHDEAIDEMSARLGKILWALIGILISTATASIMLALNLVAAR